MIGNLYLTHREDQVLNLLALGHTQKEIGVLLHVSQSTAKFHLAQLYMKLCARNQAHAVHRAHQEGLL